MIHLALPLSEAPVDQVAGLHAQHVAQEANWKR